jgi:hypothetical protein
MSRLMAESNRRIRGTDAQIVARFILDWWPGLEDGLSWPDDADNPGGHPVYLAALRISANAAAAERKDD